MSVRIPYNREVIILIKTTYISTKKPTARETPEWSVFILNLQGFDFAYLLAIIDGGKRNRCTFYLNNNVKLPFHSVILRERRSATVRTPFTKQVIIIIKTTYISTKKTDRSEETQAVG